MEFNSNKSNVLHVDINSCFATIEQQANPNLRGLPIVVVAFDCPRGCILAASIEAKKLGIKTGMLLGVARQIYPSIKSLLPDPDKYRDVHLKLKKILSRHSPHVYPKSIDEFVMKINDEPWTVGHEIKKRIKLEIGEWIVVSIGISTNRYLAKIAAGIKKPDGLIEINKDNYLKIFSKMKLTDLTGIKIANQRRLNRFGIFSVLDLYKYPKPVLGSYWNLRLRGYEVDDFKTKRKSFSNEVSLKITKNMDISPIVTRLFEKASFRARKDGFNAQKKIVQISAHKISVTLFDLVKTNNLQPDLFGENLVKVNLEKTMDTINQKMGNFVIGSARGFMSKETIKDRIAFGH